MTTPRIIVGKGICIAAAGFVTLLLCCACPLSPPAVPLAAEFELAVEFTLSGPLAPCPTYFLQTLLYLPDGILRRFDPALTMG